jgi:hypothetical protein
MTITALKRKPERVMLRVVQGALEPADQHSRAMLRDRGYKVGDVVAGELKKPRSPGFHRLAHQLGSVIVENIEAFANIPAHVCLKRVQIEGNIGCDEIAINFPNIGPCTYRVPRSLSYESMDEGEFRETIEAMCKYISKTYWPSMTPEKIERMAEMWVGA